MHLNNGILAFFAALMLFAPVSCGGNDSSPRCRNLENGRCWQCYGDECGEMASSRCGPDGICDYVPPGNMDDRNPPARGCGDGFCDRDIDEEFDCPEDCGEENTKIQCNNCYNQCAREYDECWPDCIAQDLDCRKACGADETNCVQSCSLECEEVDYKTCCANCTSRMPCDCNYPCQ